MKKNYILLLMILSAHTSWAMPGTLTSVDPDSAFAGQNIGVTVTYPAGVIMSASPGSLKFSGNGLPSFSASWMDITGYDPWNDRMTYSIFVPANQAPGLYDVKAFTGYYDWFSGTVIETDSFDLPNAFYVLEANVYGKVFTDNNGNGILESAQGDHTWANKRIDIFPDSISIYTQSDGSFFLGLPNGSHTIQVALGPGETISTGNSPATVTVTTGSVQNLGNIGVQTPATYGLDVFGSLGRRCNRVVNSYMDVRNTGNRVEDINMKLVLSSNIDFRSASPSPSSVSGDTLIWNFTSVYPGGWRHVWIIDSVPSAGDTLGYWLQGIAYNGITPVDTSISQANPIVSCSYDPNDKAVNPAGVQASNYTLKGEELFYHINFQNTGNDTAIDVSIKDTLDADLDISTFTFLGSSSPAIVSLDMNTRIVEFKMNNIMLPDSTTDEPHSHGFVDYKINHTAGIADGTEITNTAHIYFDFNPPVATNTTLNTMVTIIPTGWVDPVVGELGVRVIPNPFSQTARLVVDRKQGESCILQIWNELGELLLTNIMLSDTYMLSKDKLAPGLYFYRIDSKSGSASGRFVLSDK